MNQTTVGIASILYCFLMVGGILLFPNTSFSQIDSLDQFHSIFKELNRDGTLELTLETDFKNLVKKKYQEEYQEATLKLADTLGTPIVYKAKIRTRGNIRKKVCYYPPLKLKFKKSWLVENGMDSTFNDLKLVIGCRKGDFYNGLVLKEYLAYQLFAVLSEHHFRTQLVSITINDTGDSWKPYQTKAFIIENQDELAFRFDGRCTKPRIMSNKRIWKRQLALVALFQYMIGNTDWAFSNSHNIRFLRSRNNMKAIPIAYDFDYSGMVNAPYAVHRESLDDTGMEDIRDRYFLGSCENKKAFEAVRTIFLEKKAAFYQVVQEFEDLSEKDRKIILHYFDDFFDIMESPKAFQKQIIDACTG